MKKTLYFIIILLTILSSGKILLAQSVKISGEMRARYEYRHGYKTIIPDVFKPANFVSQRTRLNAFYESKIFKFGLVLQNVRVWGDVPQLNINDINGLSVHQAWGEVFLNKNLSIKLGRQEISYDDQRIFGAVNWTQQARSHDAAIIKFRPEKKYKLDIGFAFNAMKESLFETFYTVNNYRTFQYLWYHKDLNRLGVSFLMLNNGMPYFVSSNLGQIEKQAYSQTIGTRLTYNAEQLKFNSAFYYQGGKNKFNKSLSAFYFSANISYNLPIGLSLGIGGEYLSGTDSRNQKDSTLFDRSFKPLYGTNHKFNGWLDYFYVGTYMYNNGMIDFNMPIIQKYKNLTFKLIPHYFLAAAPVAVEQTTGQWIHYNNKLGTEIDFSMTYSLSKNMSISAGYSQMIATQTLQVLKGGNYKNTNNWAWIMFSFKPVFYSKTEKTESEKDNSK